MTRNLVWSCTTFALMTAVSASVAHPADRTSSGGPHLPLNHRAQPARCS